MLGATIHASTSVGVRIAFGSTRYFTAKQNVGRVKSFVDDLTMERGTVRMKVAFVLRSAEVQPLFRDLCRKNSCAFSPRNKRLIDSFRVLPPVSDSSACFPPFPILFSVLPPQLALVGVFVQDESR